MLNKKVRMIMTKKRDLWITVTEATEMMGCSNGWVRHLLRSEQLHGWVAGRTWIVSRVSAMEERKKLKCHQQKRKAK